ncbi:MAG: MarR family transcriptional regulator [Desulfobacterota bacterium]|nr:MarR family transcriptional regulator [Thermodesulfobacteriota bacterium]
MKLEKKGKEWGALIKRILLAYNEISKSINPMRLLKIDLTSSQVKVLVSFYGRQFYTMTELSMAHGVSVSTMTSMIDRLLNMGYIERERDTKDRRVVKVRLSAQGKKTVDYVMNVRRRELERFLSELSDEEIYTFVRSIENVATTLAKAKRELLRRHPGGEA